MADTPLPILRDVVALAEYLQSCGNKPRAWAYCRVSTAQQEAEGLSLDGQRAEILAYCQKNGIDEPVIVEEAASAGKPMLSVSLPGVPAGGGLNPRPLFALLISGLVSMAGSTLVVWKLDRFARIGDEQEMLLRLLWNANTNVRSTVVGENDLLKTGGNDPSRTLMRQIFGSFAQYERAIIQLRMQMGLRAKASTGGWVMGRPPFGYDMKNGDVVINDADAHVVRLIFYLRRVHGLSLREIGRALSFHGITTPFEKMRVKRVLDSEKMYLGIYVDPFQGEHQREDIRIIPDDLQSWAEAALTKPTPPASQLQDDSYGFPG
jgi:site-specific DNA recombinase